MTDPQAAKYGSEVTQIVAEHAPYIITGMLAVIGLVVLTLRKMGLLLLGKEAKSATAKPNPICEYCGLGSANNKDSSLTVVKCESHEELCVMVKEAHATQIVISEQQRNSSEAIAEAKREIKKIHGFIADLRIGVAVLLERSGGAPPEFKRGNYGN